MFDVVFHILLVDFI